MDNTGQTRTSGSSRRLPYDANMSMVYYSGTLESRANILITRLLIDRPTPQAFKFNSTNTPETRCYGLRCLDNHNLSKLLISLLNITMPALLYYIRSTEMFFIFFMSGTLGVRH